MLHPMFDYQRVVVPINSGATQSSPSSSLVVVMFGIGESPLFICNFHKVEFPKKGWNSLALRMGVWKTPKLDGLQLNQHLPLCQWSFQEPKLEVPTIYKACVRPMYGNIPHKIWPYMVQYLHFRILKLPLIISSSHQHYIAIISPLYLHCPHINGELYPSSD